MKRALDFGRWGTSRTKMSEILIARRLALSIVLLCGTLAVYSQVIAFEFVDFDDDIHIVNNASVRGGLTKAGVTWALTTGYAANWQPVTWLSHMVDVQLFGLDAGRHHLVNLLFHLGNTFLLFALFVRMTKREVASAAVALLFAVHPLHVESVAWVAERKDMLSAFFGLLCMHAYVSYTAGRKARDFALTVSFLALGLMSKPMLVTLPFVLLLLDYWPLSRQRQATGETPKSLVIEKLPLIGLSVVASGITMMVQRSWGAMDLGIEIPLHLRLANALVSYATYIGKMFIPDDLALLYAHPYAPGGMPLSAVELLASAAVLLTITFFCIRLREQRYLMVGWLWFLGMLVPVIGVVQVGAQAMADRYTYLPLIGLFVMVVFAVDTHVSRFDGRRAKVATTAVMLIACVGFIALIAGARQQAFYWRDSMSLLGRAAEVTSDHPVVEAQYGVVLQRLGNHDEAARRYRLSLDRAPSNARTHNNLGRALQELGDTETAVAHYRKARLYAPDYVDAIVNLAGVIAMQGSFAEGTSLMSRAIELEPSTVDHRVNLGAVLRMQGRNEDAIARYEDALTAMPNEPRILFELGKTLLSAGRARDAIVRFEETLVLVPSFEPARNALLDARAQLGSGR
jgi:tetratricopeptide (TPR) repeat protein